MMKNFFLALLISIIATSCNFLTRCRYCNDYGCDHCKQYGCAYCNYSIEGCYNCNNAYTARNERETDSDVFYARKLLGIWQCDYKTIIGSMNIKEINFLTTNICDITYTLGRQTAQYTETYNYSYVGKTLIFTSASRTFIFQIENYLYPELRVRDSFGTHVWTKRTTPII